MKRFQPKPTVAPPDGGAPGDPPARRDRNADIDFRGERQSNAAHAWTTDPDARLFRKSRGTGAKLCFIGHTPMDTSRPVAVRRRDAPVERFEESEGPEGRNGLIVQAELTHADGRAGRRAALDMIQRHAPGSTRRPTLGADKGYDRIELVADLRQACVTPHVSQKARGSAIDGRTNRHAGRALSKKRRKTIEGSFGWAKTVGGMAQTVPRRLDRVRARFILTMTANNLARLPTLLAARDPRAASRSVETGLAAATPTAKQSPPPGFFSGLLETQRQHGRNPIV